MQDNKECKECKQAIEEDTNFCSIHCQQDYGMDKFKTLIDDLYQNPKMIGLANSLDDIYELIKEQ